MNKEELTAKARGLWDKAKPYFQKVRENLPVIGAWLWRFRKFIFALPILYWAIYLGRLNYSLLPDLVGFNLQTNGEYAVYITKNAATYGPLAVTLGCLVMMFLSRKTLYPWIVCVISLLLPVAILITNIFPG